MAMEMETHLIERRSSGAAENNPANLHQKIVQLSNRILEILASTQQTHPDGKSAEIKSALESLLPVKDGKWLQKDTSETQNNIRDLFLCCAALASANADVAVMMSWIPKNMHVVAVETIRDLSEAVYSDPEQNPLNVVGNYSISYHDKGLDLTKIGCEKRLIVDLIPIIFPMIKDAIKSSCSNFKDDELDADFPSAPVTSSVIASHQMRWCLKQIQHPYIGPLSTLVIPCALTALDHWSPEVKGQGMIVLVHLAKSLNSAELFWYKDVILDATCRNIAGSEQLWQSVVEMSVTLVTCIEGRNPRGRWYGEILNEMLGEMERHTGDKECRTIWLQHIEPLIEAMGLVILAYFRRLFPLFFHWLHAKDDATVILVLKRILTITKMTWMRNTPYVERLVEELVLAYKGSSARKFGSDIRTSVVEVLGVLQLCKGLKFEEAWRKYKDDSITLPVSDRSCSAVDTKA